MAASTKRLMMFGLLAAFIVIGLHISGALPFSVVGFTDTSVKQIDWQGVTGGGCTKNVMPGNLNAEINYVASYLGNGKGETVFVCGAININPNEGSFGTVGIGTDAVSVDIYINLGQGAGEQLVAHWQTNLNPANIQGGKWYQVTNGQWDIMSPDGITIIPTGAVITTKMNAHVLWYKIFPFPTEDRGWGQVAEQKAVVTSGIGNVAFEKGQYVVGETARAKWHVGYVTSTAQPNKGWNIYIASTAQGKTVAGPIVLTQLDGYIEYVVQAADFSTAAPANELHVYLRSAVADHAWDISSTISPAFVARAPSCTTGGFTPQSPRQGQAVNVTFSCSPATADPADSVKSIKVYWGYGSDAIVHVLPAGATSDSFVAGQSGYLRVNIIAYSASNVPSAAKRIDVTVEHQPTDPCLDPTAIGCGISSLPPLLPIGILIGVGAVLLFLGILLPIRGWIRAILIIAGLAMLVFGIYLLIIYLVAAVSAFLKSYKLV
jgi:hypothetical protein